MVEDSRGKATNGENKGCRVGFAAGFVRQRAGHPKAGTQTPRTTWTHPETLPSQTQTPGYPLTHLNCLSVPPVLCSFQHLGFYPPQTPYTRPRCAQVTIAAQTREPACHSLSRDPPLPTIQERGQRAVFFVVLRSPRMDRFSPLVKANRNYCNRMVFNTVACK